MLLGCPRAENTLRWLVACLSMGLLLTHTHLLHLRLVVEICSGRLTPTISRRILDKLLLILLARVSIVVLNLVRLQAKKIQQLVHIVELIVNILVILHVL